MIIPALKLITKAATVITIAQTGYKAYQKGKVIYSAYKKTKKVKDAASSVINEVKKVVKKK